jgi:hypothetical protein
MDKSRKYLIKTKLGLTVGARSTLAILGVSIVGADRFMLGVSPNYRPNYQSIELVSAQAIPLVQLPDILNLSAQQRTQMNRLRQKTRAQISTVLGSQQIQQLATALQKDRKLLSAISSLNLPWAQQQQRPNILSMHVSKR